MTQSSQSPETRARGFLIELKSETRPEHAAIEAALGILVKPSLTLAAYRTTLERLYTFMRPLEARLAAHGGWHGYNIDLTARSKWAWLEQDLRALGVDAPRQLPACQALPALSSRAACFGCLYVLEGSTLGGQVIARHLSATLGLGANTGARYFTGYAGETAAMWRAFRSSLAAFAEEESTLAPGVIESARTTFSRLNEWCSAVPS
jgi:heme oxygenase